MTTSTRIPIDLWHSSSYRQGHPIDQYHWLLDNAPVYWHEAPEEIGGGFWAVTSHKLVKEISLDNKLFSSYAAGTMLYDMPEEHLGAVRAMMLNMDPPQHNRYRKLVGPQFLPKRAAEWQADIAQLASQIIDEVSERGECDLVRDIAGKLPSYVVAQLLGIPLEVGVRLYDLTEVMHSAMDSVTDERRAQVASDYQAFTAELHAEKTANPGNDLASSLAHAELDGQKLTSQEFQAFITLLVNAGGDTTRGLVGGGLVSLVQRPEILEQFRANVDELMPTAIDELLRFQSPVVHMRRTATEDTTIGDVSVRAGDKVGIFYAAANRDPAVFDNPDDIILDRNPNPHVAFGGGGPHFCLGSHFARIEIDTIFRQILTRLQNIELTEEPTWVPSNFTCGPQHAPIRFTPSPKAADLSHEPSR
ncbi:cytochrome P450 [Antricoccus suffuscus]|uniref:Cytochrome P450 n=1 Tax=Antricoccus suffuscus TaxID=1629062 RepID=A0A2T0ZWY3_9ACTN|nr:cytochrome P450 [Antricoccus suffuscus]PRZ40843.1 cytochrome P450 [Antricoccus suffuscus]